MTPTRERFEALLPAYVNGQLDGADLLFMVSCLRDEPWAQSSLALSSAMKKSVQAHSPLEGPTTVQVAKFLERWSDEQSNGRPQTIPSDQVKKKPLWSLSWRLPVSGMALAASALIAVVGLGPQELAVLHPDTLDGQPDISLVLKAGKSVDDPEIQTHLSNAGAVVLSDKVHDGQHHVTLDLNNRSKMQDDLINAMRDGQHLQAYALLGDQ